MAGLIGKQAVVVGAGMGGLTAARALADSFERVLVLAARDPAVHKLVAEVQHLLKPRSVYQDPELVQRVLAVMAEG